MTCSYWQVVNWSNLQLKPLERRWKCSEPEYLQEHAPMRFCGFELTKVEHGIRMDQCGYTLEMLKKYEVEQPEGCPLPKISEEETADESFSAQDLRRAQSIVGELLWLSTRTRPDLAFGVGLLGRQVHKKTTDSGPSGPPHAQICQGHQ